MRYFQRTNMSCRCAVLFCSVPCCAVQGKEGQRQKGTGTGTGRGDEWEGGKWEVRSRKWGSGMKLQDT